jgi:polyhydroxybutyrate depolymerase
MLTRPNLDSMRPHRALLAALFGATALLGAVACAETDDGDAPRDLGADAPDIADASDVADAGAADMADATDVADASEIVEVDLPDFPEAPETLGGERPASYRLPADYDAAESWPLAILLHGYSASGLAQDLYLGFSQRAERAGIIAVVPDGTANSEGKLFWNATDACCNFEGDAVDDVAYITSLIDEAARYFHVDPARVYLLGHSNGGFMAHRYICDVGDRVAGIVSLAGATYFDASDCAAPAPTAVLQVHGTEDGTIAYEGSRAVGFRYPSATESAHRWATRNGCGEPEVGEPFDIDLGVEGAETVPTDWSGCPAGASVALWTLEGGSHLPGFGDRAFIDRAFSWLLAQERAGQR